MEFKGFNKITKKLESLDQCAKKLEHTHEIPLNVLLNRKFLRRYTSFKSFDDLLENGNFQVTSIEDLEAIPKDILDKYISSVTRFPSWESMLNKSLQVYVSSQLSFM